MDWSQQELAKRAQVARKTIADFELGQVTPYPRTLRDVVAALEGGGVAFIPAEEGVFGPGVRLKWKAQDGAEEGQQTAFTVAPPKAGTQQATKR
jgi:transcriptional regulator with XRE-family HTH domain